MGVSKCVAARRALVALVAGVVVAVAVAGVAAAASVIGTAARPHAASRPGASLPRVLRFVDRSRAVRSASGRPAPRPVTTYLRYPRSGSGPWPLIVFGHGFASTPDAYRRLLDSWADAGYLVAAPLFPLGNANAPGGPNRSDLPNQPRDMSFVITRLLADSAAPESPLHGLVDPTRIAVAGHSDGAMTAFAAAYESGFRDRRIDAAVIFSGARLSGRAARFPHSPPLLAVQGTDDRLNNPANADVLYGAVARPKFVLWLRRADHLPPDTSRAYATVERATIAFLDHYLRGRPLSDLSRAAARYGVGVLDAAP